MTVGGRAGISSTHPSALKPDRSLRYGKPLISPGWAAPEYLSCILQAVSLLHCPGNTAQILSAPFEFTLRNPKKKPNLNGTHIHGESGANRL